MKGHHTKRDLVRIFNERGIQANRRLGQNFLVDHNVLEFICNAGDLSADDAVLEIGAGTGLLTQHLGRSGARVVAVEIDRKLFDVARECLGEKEHVLVLCCDVHGARRRLNPAVESALEDAMKSARRLKVISNLPYCISSDLVISLLEMQWAVERMVLVVQREFAARLLARPGTRDYCPLTVLLGARAKVQRLRDLAPAVFWPAPKVGSSVIRILPDAAQFSAVASYPALKSVVAALFAQRRKKAAAALKGMVRRRLSAEQVRSALDAAGIQQNARADGLTVEQTVALSNALGSGHT